MIKLFDFQSDAVDQMADAIDEWSLMRAKTGRVLRAPDPIPFMGAFDAIMGSGKTPLLAATLARLGPAIVVWTTKSSPTVDQTYDNLRGSGKYAHLLPSGTKVIRGMPARTVWRQILDDTAGLTIWVMTTASWNRTDETKEGLHLRRQQRDWAGEIAPWDQLRPEHHARPLWVVYDESHNQTDAQLDQILEIGPHGILTGSGTTKTTPKLRRSADIVAEDPDFGPIHARAQVKIRTFDVVSAGLLKRDVRIGDANGDPEAVLDAVMAGYDDLVKRGTASARMVEPRAIYVVEESNARDGGIARPVAIWQMLVDRGVSPDAIAVFTATKGDLPIGLEKVTNLDGLRARHRHIIFNKALEEGWDDPENYLLYIDGDINVEQRIKQVIGRVLRQPGATHFDDPALNAAYLHINCRDELFDQVVSRIADDLSERFGADDQGRSSIRVTTTKNARLMSPRDDAAEFALPNLELVRPPFDDVFDRLRSEGENPFADEDLEAEGIQRWRRIELSTEDRHIVAEDATRITRNTMTTLRDAFGKRLRAHNRFAANLVPMTANGPLAGPRWKQRGCHGSAALAWVDEIASWVADTYEERAAYDETVNPARATWSPGAFSANGRIESFVHAAHAGYPLGNPWLNNLELAFARELDKAGGRWARNPSFGDGGYSIPLAKLTGSSQRFFPDFVWWVDGKAWVIDTTAGFLMAEKVAGKLADIVTPRVALVAQGRLDEAWSSVDKAGWTIVVREGGDVRREYFTELAEMFTFLRAR